MSGLFPLGGPVGPSSPRRTKQYNYSVEVEPDNATDEELQSLVHKLEALKVGKAVWRDNSIAVCENAFGEKSVQGAFTTTNRSDSEAMEEEIEDWPGVANVSVTKSVLEFKISKHPVKATGASPFAATTALGGGGGGSAGNTTSGGGADTVTCLLYTSPSPRDRG